MSSPTMTFLFLQFFALVFLSSVWHPVQALRNISIDNSDPIINYSGQWPFDNSYRSGATDHYSPSTGASATIEFTGVAVYYRVHLYPSNLPAGGLLSVDNYAATGVVMWDPSGADYARNSTDVWCMTGLPNGTHTLNVKFWNNGNNEYLTLDTILATQLEAGDPVSDVPTFSPVSGSQTSTSSVTGSPDSASDNNGTSNSSNKTLPIALGTVFGVLFLGAAGAAGFLFYRLRQYRAAHGTEGKLLLSDGTVASTNIQYDPYNPDGGMQQHQEAYGPIVASMAQYSSPVPPGTESSTNHSPLPGVRMSSAMNSSQTSLHGGSSRMVPGGAQLSSRLPEV
ncbi:hypothetical protein VKT23_011140 [Stygiomarasmius scandens]|uniref:Uncharacterized protein n=1 Tax=Marasmiellus scandens TaxID=2682957 RepID=A0ABR1JF54_9AGAR